MNYDIHRLELHRDIVSPPGAVAPDGTVAIVEYESRVRANDLEPKAEDHLAGGTPVGSIPKGFYFFTQGPCGEDGEGERPLSLPESDIRDAAEAVWLESLWKEIPFSSDRILVRILSEEGDRIFQVFREIPAPSEP